MRDKHRISAIQVLLLVVLTIFAIHLMAHMMGVYQHLGMVAP